MKSTITWLFTLAALVALPGAWAQKQNIGNLIGLYDRLPECAVCIILTMTCAALVVLLTP